MSKDIFGLTSERLKRRLYFERTRAEAFKEFFCELLEQIKFTSEEDGWQRLVLFSSSNSALNGLSYSERAAVLYYLRRHQNIISKLSDKEKRANTPDSMKPYLFKWVRTATKERLGAQANCFRNLTQELLNKIDYECPDRTPGVLVDVLSVLEFLLGKRNKTWIEISAYNISAFSGVPIENTRAALNMLLKMKLIVMAYVPCEERTGRLRLNIYVTLTEDDYNQAVSGAGIDAVQILTNKNASNEFFKFVTVNYFYGIVAKGQYENEVKRFGIAKNQSNAKEDDSQVEDEDTKIFKPSQVSIPLNLEDDSAEEKIPVEVEKTSEVEEKNLPAQISPSINIVMPEVPELGKTLDDIKSCVVSFTNIAESMYNSEAQKYELLKNMIQASTKQREEYDDLYNQMVAMKKILNQKDRDKDRFVKAIQDALNMMMGKIISETDKFSKIPRHMLDEQKIQAHKAEVIQITVQTAEEIRRLAAN